MKQLDDTIKKFLSYSADTGEFTRLTGQFKDQPVGTKDSQGYIIISILGERHMAHRVAWFLHYGKNPVGQIDHINRIVDDNRICNLREVSPSENLFNQRLKADNTSGVRGVSWVNAHEKYSAYIYINKKKICLGNYSLFYQAVVARLEAEYMYLPAGYAQRSSAYEWLKKNYQPES